jgi:hypothetical protein
MIGGQSPELAGLESVEDPLPNVLAGHGGAKRSTPLAGRLLRDDYIVKSGCSGPILRASPLSLFTMRAPRREAWRVNQAAHSLVYHEHGEAGVACRCDRSLDRRAGAVASCSLPNRRYGAGRGHTILGERGGLCRPRGLGILALARTPGWRAASALMTASLERRLGRRHHGGPRRYQTGRGVTSDQRVCTSRRWPGRARGYSCPTQAQSGSAQGPEQSAWQCMLIRCPHGHRPRTGRGPGRSSLGSDGRREGSAPTGTLMLL